MVYSPYGQTNHMAITIPKRHKIIWKSTVQFYDLRKYIIHLSILKQLCKLPLHLPIPYPNPLLPPNLQNFVTQIREILYKGKDQIAWKQLRRPEGSQPSDMQQFILILVICIFLNLLSCLPFGLQTGFSRFSKLAESSPV